MLSLMSFAYLLPVVIAMLIAGLVVNGRIGSAARGFMWTGIVLLILSQSTTLVTTALVRSRMPTWTYSAVSLTSLFLNVIGVVLLILAIGRAARDSRPSTPAHPGAPGYPSGPGWPAGGQSGPAGTPGYGQPTRPATPGQPAQPGGAGQWNNPGPWGGQS